MINFLSKIYKKETIKSELNGEIVVDVFFGTKTLSANGVLQSTDGMGYDMWNKAIKKIPKHEKIDNVLVLGVGAGGVIKNIQKRFKKAKILAVDYDEKMIEIAKTFLFFKNKNIEIVHDNAFEFIEKTDRKFDLIIFDLFNGENIPMMAFEKSTLNNLSRILKRYGFLILNYYKTDGLKEIFDKYFSCYSKFRYYFNGLSVYKKFGAGNLNDSLPDFFTNYNAQSDYFIKSALANYKDSCVVGDIGCRAVATSIGFVRYETYISNIEPKKLENKSFLPKIISWENNLPENNHSGWISSIHKSSIQHGYVFLKNKKDNYFDEWSTNAKRLRTKWLEKDSLKYEIVESNFEDFKKACYKISSYDLSLRALFVGALKYKLRANLDNHVKIWLIRDIVTKDIVSGLAVSNYFDLSMSSHSVAFTNKKIQGSSFGIGLIDHWYKYCLDNNIDFVDFGVVWKKGDPMSWKGYSDFKKQFGPYLCCPGRWKFLKVLFRGN